MGYFYNENTALENTVNEYFIKLSEYNDSHYHGKLSVLLLGSLSRGEATWMKCGDKDLIFSDIEFFTVYPDGFNKFDEFEKQIQDTKHVVFADQNLAFFHVDNTFVSRRSLPGMEKKLLMYDAEHFGKCVVGKDIMHLLPRTDLSNINYYDIRDILTHRVFSVLYYGFPLKEQGKIEQYRYSLAKNSLDLMTVMLVEHGQLTSGFLNRFSEICEVITDEEEKNYFSFCLSVKLSDERNINYSIGEMEKQFIQIVEELNSNFKIPFGNKIKNIKYIIRRCLGILKRSIKYKHIVKKNYFLRLIVSFRSGESINERELADNLVLYGYPLKAV